VLPGVRPVVFSRNAGHTRAQHDADHVVPARELTREEIVPEIKRLDLLLLGGGGLLYDGEAQVYLRGVRIAQALGVPTMAFAIGVGPLNGSEERQATREALPRMQRVTVREPTAKRLLEEIGVDAEIAVTADPALLLTPEPFTEQMLAAEGIRCERNLVGMSVREPGGAAPHMGPAYHDLIANAADYMVERFEADVLFVPMEPGDLRHAHAVMAHMTGGRRAYVLREAYSPRHVLGLLPRPGRSRGMRLHFRRFPA